MKVKEPFEVISYMPRHIVKLHCHHCDQSVTTEVEDDGDPRGCWWINCPDCERFITGGSKLS